uniref:High molecular weight glutenin subunit n=1 Tax=Pseudoroegneria spicata TaxID=4604 RepID=V9XW44_PSEPI|nr:high molecular weight glutenin subunit [Pseudoroegneria spicata]
MAKRLVLFAAVVVALVALTAAEGGASGQLQCERELQESSLEACWRVVDQQLAGQLPWSTGLQMRCCQQLRDVSPECRPVAVSQVARQYEQQTAVPPKGGSFYPGEATPPQQLQQRIFWGRSSQTVQGYYPSVTSPQQGSYYPGQASPQQPGQGQQQGQWQEPGQGQQPGQWQQPGQGQQGYYPTSPQQPGQGQQPGQWQQPGQRQQPGQWQQPGQGQQGYYPTSPQQPGQWQRSGQGQEPGQGQQGYYPTSLQQPAQGQQPGQGQQSGQEQQGYGSPYHVSAEQQLASLKVAKAQQLAAQLPAMCRLEGGGALSASQ